jgi:hypothetical protein
MCDQRRATIPLIAHLGNSSDSSIGREVDGPQRYNPDARWADAALDADFAAAGVVVVRIAAYAIRHHPDDAVTRLNEVWLAATANTRHVWSAAGRDSAHHTSR